MKSLGALALSLCLALVSATALAWDRGNVETFATLPAGDANPEGITVDRHGDVYVSLFAVTATSGPGKVVVFDDDGSLKRELTVAGSSNLLLGLAFHPQTNELLVLDFGNGRVLRVNPHNGTSSVFMEVGAGSGLNALTFDSAGNVYVSDSFQGVIWRTGPRGGAPTAWVKDPLLTTTGYPPFGANGIDFNSDESAMFIANTGDDRIIRVPVAAGVAGKPDVFTSSINGADGLFVDKQDNIWVCANQADEIVVVGKTGRAIAKLGDFNGLRNGSPRGLLFPASLVKSGDWIYITNLSLDLRLFGLPQSVDTQWTAEVKRHTIARIPARIPGR
jgi:sugar lactone lactonase YvrE